MKKYKHKQTGDMASYNGSKYIVDSIGLYVPDRYIENSNDWVLIPSIEVGKIYKSSKTPVIVLIKEEVDSVDAKCMGFDGFGNWCKLSYFSIEHLVEATKEEWFERLKEEAIKRGLVEGARFNGDCIVNDYMMFNFSLVDVKRGYLMNAATGKWATPIEENKLTTHDGFDLFEGDELWAKEKAQEYIDLHQKKYSLADLKEALNNLKNK